MEGTKMSENVEDVGKPCLTKISRRKFTKLLALGSGAAALAATGISIISCKRPATQLETDDIPIRNPAFRAIPSSLKNRTILYCQTGKDEYLAYDVNSAGYEIWQRCVAHSEFVEGIRKSVLQVASEVVDYFDIRTVQDFISLMYSRGLVYSGKHQSQAYFVYEERHR
jgi:hypothetical protein